MRLFSVALLVTAMLCNSTLAIAAGPVPFSALMRTAGVEPSMPPINDSGDQPTPASNQPGRTPHMTTGGKVMTGVGVGMFVIGTLGIAGTASFRGWASPSDKAKLYGASGGAMAVGAILIVLGAHRRAAQ